MSGHSYSTICPNCNNEANANTETRPFEMTSMECLHCGFQTSTYADFMNLEELNERRIEGEMEPLTELPEQDEDLKI